MGLMVGLDDESATLAWVIGAFEHVLNHNQTRLVPYMIELCEELVFQMEVPEHLSALRARYQLLANL